MYVVYSICGSIENLKRKQNTFPFYLFTSDILNFLFSFRALCFLN